MTKHRAPEKDRLSRQQTWVLTRGTGIAVAIIIAALLIWAAKAVGLY